MNVNVALFPLQMVVVPAMLPVGVGITVISALPVIEGLGAVTEHKVTVLVTLTIV